MDVIIFGIHLTINPVAFTIPIGSGWSVYWYGIIIAAGFILAILYAYKNAERFNINTDKMLDAILVTTPLAILSARSYYLIFDGEKGNFFSEFFSFNGRGFTGLAIYGGVIGTALFGTLMCKIKKISIADMLDLTAIGFLIGQGIGRWGNFVNQEAFGMPTGSDFFGMTSQNVVSDFLSNGYSSSALAHPCFLYESVWCIVGFFILHKLSKSRKFSGETALMYCVWYGFGRTFIELLRTDSLMLGKIKVSSLLSAVICIAALSVVIYKRSKIRSEHMGEYSPVYTEEIGEEDENGEDN